MRLFEIDAPLKVLATSRFVKEFAERSRDKIFAKSGLDFIEHRRDHDLDQRWGRKDSPLNPPFKNVWHVHIIHGKLIILYRRTSTALLLFAVVEHNAVEGGKKTSDAIASWIDGLRIEDFTEFQLPGQVNYAALAKPFLADLEQVLWSFSTEHASLKAIAAGQFDEFLEYARVGIDGNFSDEEKDKIALAAFSGAEGLKAKAAEILKQSGLKEDAHVSMSKTFYHGTSSEEAAISILANGLRPGTTKFKGKLKPVPGMVYATEHIFRTFDYMFANNAAVGYLFVLEAPTGDVYPDEDSIGRFIERTTKLVENEPAFSGNDRLRPIWDEIVAIAEMSNLRSMLEMRTARAIGIAGITIGKAIMKKLSPAVRAAIIDFDGNVAIAGSVRAAECWKIPGDKASRLATDGHNLAEIGERVGAPQISEDAPASSSLLADVDLASFETFTNSLKRVPRPQMLALQEVLTALNNERLKPNPSYIEVFHGAPRKAAEDIKANGFKLTTGRRGGFMGAIHHVENNGIFLTDSKPLARYFGSNRSEYGNDYEMLSCFIDPSHVLDTAKAPREIEKLGLAIIQKWDGSTPRRIPVAEWWWLMDNKEFVDLLKIKGYTGARFREDRAVRKDAGVDSEANTFCMFDPSAIKVLAKDMMRVQGFYEWLKDNGSDPRLKKAAEPVTENYDPENVFATIGGYTVTVDDKEDCRFVAVYDEAGKRIGSLSTRTTPDLVGREYLSISRAELLPAHRGKGLGIAMYRALLAHLGPRWKGIGSYLPDQANRKQVPAIWKRIGGHPHPKDADHIVADRQALTEALAA